MEPIRVLLLRSESHDPSPMDQSLGARLSALYGPGSSRLLVEEEHFRREDFSGMEKKLALRQGKISGVIGATNVPESARLGELAAQMNLLCFVANNNPLVWQGRKHVFHIGLPSPQTAEAVATLLHRAQCKRIFLLYDQTEFQSRVASSMETALTGRGMKVNSQPASADGTFELLREWKADLIYVIFSSEQKALPVARRIRERVKTIPLLFGRSLLRESFLSSLDENTGESWFVDMFHRNSTQTESQLPFMRALSAQGISIPTANHAFGWDAMSFCALALKAAQGEPSSAVDHLDSGVMLEGATGTCSFSRDNHNGRSGLGPTTLTRWINGRLEEV